MSPAPLTAPSGSVKSVKQSSKDDAAMEIDDDDFDNAVSYMDARPDESIRLFQSILARPASDASSDLAKLKEESILHLATLYSKLDRTAEFKQLFTSIRPFFATLHKSRTAKIVRQLIDTVSSASSQSHLSEKRAALQLEICRDAVEWCRSERRTFLRQRIETRLASVLVHQKQYVAALELIKQLSRSVKRFDDKLLLVEIYLIESRCQLQLANVAKSKGALTAARSNANAIYCPPALQSEIDLQAGILCSREHDYKTAYSYFYEAYEGFNTTKNTPNAVRSIKYMMLSKIMTKQYDDVQQIVQGKAGLKYGAGATSAAGSSLAVAKTETSAATSASVALSGAAEIEAMSAIAQAYAARDIAAFDAVFAKHATALQNDSVIQAHLVELKRMLVESNLQRLIEPYSHVEISHIAQLIALPREQVERTLSNMILDCALLGVIDQNTDVLIVFDSIEADPVYEAALGTVKELHNVMDELFIKARELHQ